MKLCKLRTKILTGVIIMLSCVMINITPTFAAGCGVYETTGKTSYSCDNVWCGPNGLLRTYRQSTQWRRLCVRDNNTTKYEFKYTYKHIKCC